ncbi:MAG: O-succinylhomoserine sulfhydrylase [Bacteroidota bacterium]
MNEEKGFSTGAVRNQTERTQYREHATPLFLTSSFVFDTAEQMTATFAGEEAGIIYSRYNNPTVDELIRKVCSMEGCATGFATASGMAAVFASLAAFVKAGDHILATRAVFGSTHQLLMNVFPRWGVETTYVDPTKVDSWQDVVRPTTRILLIETPSNPGLTLVDLAAAGEFARRHGLLYLVDNCFATPYLQRPAEFGADIVIHSATKWMDGQGRVLGGLIVGKEDYLKEVTFFCRHTGPAMSPFNAWLLSKSLETLVVRMDAHCQNALQLAEWLSSQDKIEAVHYPFLPSHPQYALAKKQMHQGGGIVTFELKGGIPVAQMLINGVQICSRSSNLGDTRTILTHPATTTHSKLTEAERQAVGITPGLVRMSVGLENVEDIKADILQALHYG